MLEDDAVYCVECGEKQEVEEFAAQNEETATPMEKKCIYCGKSIEADCAFCPFCGKPQEEKGHEMPNTKESSNEDEQVEGTYIKEESIEQDSDVENAEDHPTEKKKKSKVFLWILFALLIVFMGVWYFGNDILLGKYSSSDNDNESAEELKAAEERKKNEEMLAFVKDFYLHYKDDDDYVYNNVTKEVLKQLRRDNPYYCDDGDCLATWVFSAYPAGADMNLEVGPIITQHGSIFLVTFKYSYIVNGMKKYEERSIRLYVEGNNGQYKIVAYNYDDKSQAPRYDKDKRISVVPEGKYNLSLGNMHVVLSIYDSKVEGEYYFKAGSSVGISINLSGKANNGLKLHLSQTNSVSGESMGFMDGTFDGKTFKGNYDKDGYKEDFEVYVEE